MGGVLSRTVEIQISNNTQSFTLKNPRTYFYNGHISIPPRPSLPPDCNDSFKFTTPSLKGCAGILVYEAESFTLAIYFCNPLDYNRFSMELGLELSLSKAHLEVLEDIYARMAKGKRPPTAFINAYDHVTLDTCHKAAQVRAGNVRVGATMSNDRNSIIRVVLEDLEGQEKEVLYPGKHV